ncbi:MAG: peptidylprolyl isomerase [Acidobacteriota bacterium]
MLNVLRENLRHLKWILLLVVASFIITIFAVWGGGGFRQRGREEEAPDWAALVDGEPVSIPEFIRSAKNIDEFYSRLYGDRYSEIRKNLNLGAQVIGTLIEQKMILQEAKALGITATPEEVSQKIMSYPAFMENGLFIGKERYTRLLRATERDIGEFESGIRDSIIMEKWRNLIADNVFISPAELEREYRETNEKVSFDYIFLSSASYENEVSVGDEEARAHFFENNGRYRKAESRRAKFIVLSRDDLKKEVQITENDIKVYYRNNISDFQQTEQVAAKHILIKVDPNSTPETDEKAKKDIEEILSRARRGESFEELAKKFSQDEGSSPNGGDLGRFQRGMMVKEFEDVAFSLAVGAISDVVRTQFGYHIIKVTEKIPERLITLEEARDRIMRELEYEKTQDLLESKMNKIRAEMTSSERFEEVAKRYALPIMDTGFITREQRVPETGTALEFQKVLFSLKPFEIGGPVAVARGLSILLFTEEQEAKIPAFEEVRNDVVLDLRQRKAAEKAYEFLRVALIESGRNIESLAKKLKLEVKHAREITRRHVIPEVGSVPSTIEELLRYSPGDLAGPVKTPHGAILAKIQDVVLISPERFASEKETFKENLLSSKREVLIDGIIQHIRARKDIKVNSQLIKQIGI